MISSLRSSFAISHGVDIVVALVVVVGLAAPAWHHQMPRFQKMLVVASHDDQGGKVILCQIQD
jgi:hypothetical protein